MDLRVTGASTQSEQRPPQRYTIRSDRYMIYGYPYMYVYNLVINHPANLLYEMDDIMTIAQTQ